MLRASAAQHTLTCSACGASLRNLKMLPVAAPVQKPAISHQPSATTDKDLCENGLCKSAEAREEAKEAQSFFRKFAEEAFDLVEDIFD